MEVNTQYRNLWEESMKLKLRTSMLALATASLMAAGGQAGAWSLEEAAKPYAGTEVNVLFLDRPGYNAVKKMLPEFESKTGIKMNITTVPYENALGEQVRDFVAGGDIDIALVDLVWLGNFAENGWVVPVETFTGNAALADPDLDMADFFQLPLKAFGEWNGKLYGLPFDNYSGLMFYNSCMLKDAGFDAPPATWQDVMDKYGPALTKDGKFAYALQSKRNETQSADSFARFLWPFGGSFLTADFKSNLNSPESQAGLKFRQDLMKFMPPGIVAYDHSEAVNALAQGDVGFITEWSAFYSTLASPETSKLGDCLAVAPEPKGPAGRKPALGGFSLAVASQADDNEKAAGWLFIQWATSKANAGKYLELGGVPARQSAYVNPDLAKTYKFIPALVESWKEGVPEFRPRFAEWPAITEIVQEWGTKMMLGEVSVEDGAKTIGEKMEVVLKDAGYYDGKKPFAQ
jgi:multiple sugar transport system substrate-binding protein